MRNQCRLLRTPYTPDGLDEKEEEENPLVSAFHTRHNAVTVLTQAHTTDRYPDILITQTAGRSPASRQPHVSDLGTVP